MGTLNRWLNPHDLASPDDQYQISIKIQNRLRSEKKIPYSKVGRQVRYDRIELDKWLEDHKVV